MSEEKPQGAKNVAVIILIIIGITNFGYGVFRMTQGEELAPPLFIAGTMCLVLASILATRS